MIFSRLSVTYARACGFYIRERSKPSGTTSMSLITNESAVTCCSENNIYHSLPEKWQVLMIITAINWASLANVQTIRLNTRIDMRPCITCFSPFIIYRTWIVYLLILISKCSVYLMMNWVFSIWRYSAFEWFYLYW